MKAILEFDLSDEYERQSHLHALKADRLVLMISELYDKARTLYKYSENEQDINKGEWLRELLNELKKDNGLEDIE